MFQTKPENRTPRFSSFAKKFISIGALFFTVLSLAACKNAQSDSTTDDSVNNSEFPPTRTAGVPQISPEYENYGPKDE